MHLRDLAGDASCVFLVFPCCGHVCLENILFGNELPLEWGKT